MSHIYIATPSYGAPVYWYLHALTSTIPALERAGHQVQWKVLEGCCYVHLARNKLVRDFLMSEADELLFIDADIGWRPEEMLRLAGHDKPIVGAAAPFGIGEPGFPVHAIPAPSGCPLAEKETGLVLVDVLPTAVMKIKRQAFMDLAAAKKAPLRIEMDRHTGKERERYLSFFDFETDNERCIEFGEDVTFCRKWMSLGGELWVDPNVTLKHVGIHFREGNWHEHLMALPGGASAEKAQAA